MVPVVRDITLYTYFISILLSAVIALAYRRSLATRKISILVVYLFYTFFQEFISQLYWWNGSSPNPIIFNIYKIITVLVFGIVYYQIPFIKSFRKIMIWLAALYIAANIIVFSFFQSPFSYNSYITLARGLIITFFALFFLFSYFHLDNSKEENYWRPMVWITTGVVIFYPVTSISLAFNTFLHQYQATVYGIKLYQFIPQLMSIFMYSCFSYAFYLCRKIESTSS